MNTIFGNWKMNHSLNEIQSFFSEIGQQLHSTKTKFGIAPQSIHIPILLKYKEQIPNLLIGAQNCHFEESGAFTGEVSPKNLKDLGVDFCLVGHSERREYFKEDHELLNKKVRALLKNEMTVVFCFGETLEQREAGNTATIVLEQLNRGLVDIPLKPEQIILAYEPVWAIGTGQTATPEQAQEVHALIRGWLSEKTNCANDFTILYGGSVKPNNIKDLVENKDINGGLVGGASLKASDFIALCTGAEN